jgi:pimeloyl-ACP methyl ester carboxylesterase
MSAADPARPLVILVHGLWFGAWAMRPLGRRLRAQGFEVRRFSYRSTGRPAEDNALALLAYLEASRSGPIHIVAHSLGGIVALLALGRGEWMDRGRLVLMGTPLRGSTVARSLGRIAALRGLLGRARPALENGLDELPGGREIGMIAGNRPIGLGLLLGGTDGPGDGTVAVRETAMPGLADHLVLPLTHTGMLYAREVASQAAHFLRFGWFKMVK